MSWQLLSAQLFFRYIWTYFKQTIYYSQSQIWGKPALLVCSQIFKSDILQCTWIWVFMCYNHNIITLNINNSKALWSYFLLTGRKNVQCDVCATIWRWSVCCRTFGKLNPMCFNLYRIHLTGFSIIFSPFICIKCTHWTSKGLIILTKSDVYSAVLVFL